MNNRVKELRKSLKLTQEEFAKMIHLSRSNLGAIENGRVKLTPRVINDICKTFSVSEEWLTKGEGKTFEVIDDNEQFNKVLGEWLIDCDPITRETVLSLSKLSRSEFEFVSKILKNLVNEKK
ncbi:helix-turn-helix transcriptional regulator [Clostridium perfringens]